MGKAIGIDLGTTNSVVAFKDTAVKIIQTGVNNQDLCRSCVALDKSDQFLVGNLVYNNWKRYSPNIVTSIKRLMGASFNDEYVQKMILDTKTYPYTIKKPSGGTEDAVAVLLKGKEYSPEEISAEIIRSLKNDANNKLGDVTHAVITVPAYFTEKQKSATKRAAELAGIYVQQLLAEPTAAAISFGFDQMIPGESKQVLVYDFGGGTFDLSIIMAVDGQFIETGSGGDRWIGGDDIDRILSDYARREIERRESISINELLEKKSDKEKAEFIAGLKSGVEEAKKTLSQVDNATIFFSNFLEDDDFEPIDDLTISRTTFDSLISPLINRTIDLIEDLLSKTGIPVDTLDNILLIGGSSCIPLVKKMLSDRYGASKVLSSEKPMLAVAEGAAILAHSLPSIPLDKEPIDELINDPIGGIVVLTTKHKTFIELLDANNKLTHECIIDSQEVLPMSTHRKFRTSINNQKIVEIKLFNDTENGEKTKTATGFFTISDNLPAMSELTFSFNLDENETMTAKVKIVKTGKETEIRLGRGLNDSRFLSELSLKVETVFNNDKISNKQKAAFISEIQQIIDNINKNNYSSTDSNWTIHEEELNAAYTRVLIGENNENNIFEILGITLLDNFEQFLRLEDKKMLNEYLLQIKNSSDEFEKEAIRQKIEEVTDKYMLLIQVFYFKIIAHSSTTPLISSRAMAVYESLILALKDNDIPTVHGLMNMNDDLLSEIKNGSINIGASTGLV